MFKTAIGNMKNGNKDKFLENIHWVTHIVSGSEIIWALPIKFEEGLSYIRNLTIADMV